MHFRKLIQALLVVFCFALASVSVQAFACEGHAKGPEAHTQTETEAVKKKVVAQESEEQACGCEKNCDKCGTDECPKKETCDKGKKS